MFIQEDDADGLTKKEQGRRARNGGKSTADLARTKRQRRGDAAKGVQNQKAKAASSGTASAAAAEEDEGVAAGEDAPMADAEADEEAAGNA